MDNYDQALELLIKRTSEGLGLKLNKSEYSKDLKDYSNTTTKFITNAVNDLVNYYKKSEVYTKGETDNLLSALHSISMKVVETLPESDQQSNVIYLVPAKGPNPENAKDEFIWLEGKWELIGTTRIATTQVFEAEKTSFEKADSEVIDEYFKTGAGKDKGKAAGDHFVITVKIDGAEHHKNAYVLDKDGVTWKAIDGKTTAGSVIFKDNITGAGRWDRVGNIKKDANGTVNIPVKGKSVEEILNSIFYAEEQPNVLEQPSVSNFKLTEAGAVEVGTKITVCNYGTAFLNKGKYEFGPETGITPSKITVRRECEPAAMSTDVGTADKGTDDNGGKGFIIGDAEGEGVVTSLKYKCSVQHTVGAVAHNSAGKASNPQIKINAGTVAATSEAITGFRAYFYGGTENTGEPNSAIVRGTTASTKPYKAGDEITFTVNKGTKKVLIACLGTEVGVTKVVNNTFMNLDVTETFVKKENVNVEGKNGYTAKPYNVWVYAPAVPYEKNTTFTVTLG